MADTRINPKFYCYYSNRFIHFLETNKHYTLHPYMEIISSKEKKLVDERCSITLIDIGSTNDMISYIEADKLLKLFMEDEEFKNEKSEVNFSKWITSNYTKSETWKKYRTEVKAGRFLKRFIPTSTDVQCEEFNNIYKSYLDGFNYSFEIVGGDEIIKYFNKDNYDITNRNGGLFKSCMAFDDQIESSFTRNRLSTISSRLQFYSKNPNCALLILRYKGSDKIKGRCLIWKTMGNRIYMDRVYVDFDSDTFLYKKYGMDNNYYAHVLNRRTSMEIESNREILNLFRNAEIPYLDTFRYDRNANRITYNI